MGKKMLEKIAYVDASCGKQHALMFFQESGKLADVGGISADRKWRQPLLDSQVVEKAGEHARVGIESHEQGIDEYECYRTLAEVTNRVPTTCRNDVACYVRLPPASRNNSTAYRAPSGVSSCLK